MIVLYCGEEIEISVPLVGLYRLVSGMSRDFLGRPVMAESDE